MLDEVCEIWHRDGVDVDEFRHRVAERLVANEGAADRCVDILDEESERRKAIDRRWSSIDRRMDAENDSKLLLTGISGRGDSLTCWLPLSMFRQR